MFKALRTRWLDHQGSASRRPVILVDEAREMTPMVLRELRLLRAPASIWDDRLTDVMSEQGVVVHEEAVVETLLTDLAIVFLDSDR